MFQPFFTTHCPPSLCQKSEKTTKQILHKVQKTPFLGSFFGSPNLPKKFFLRKSGSVEFWVLSFCIFCTKFRGRHYRLLNDNIFKILCFVTAKLCMLVAEIHIFRASLMPVNILKVVIWHFLSYVQTYFADKAFPNFHWDLILRMTTKSAKSAKFNPRENLSHLSIPLIVFTQECLF